MRGDVLWKIGARGVRGPRVTLQHLGDRVGRERALAGAMPGGPEDVRVAVGTVSQRLAQVSLLLGHSSIQTTYSDIVEMPISCGAGA